MDQSVPQDGIYIARPGSSMTGDSSGVDSSGFSMSSGMSFSGPSAPNNQVRFSETSNDTGRGSSGCGSDNEIDVSKARKENGPLAGPAASDPRLPGKRFSIKDDVFLEGLPDIGPSEVDGPEPGTERLLFEKFFANRKISADSAVGRMSQGDMLPDYSLVA